MFERRLTELHPAGPCEQSEPGAQGALPEAGEPVVLRIGAPGGLRRGPLGGDPEQALPESPPREWAVPTQVQRLVGGAQVLEEGPHRRQHRLAVRCHHHVGHVSRRRVWLKQELVLRATTGNASILAHRNPYG